MKENNAFASAIDRSIDVHVSRLTFQRITEPLSHDGAAWKLSLVPPPVDSVHNSFRDGDLLKGSRSVSACATE